MPVLLLVVPVLIAVFIISTLVLLVTLPVLVFLFVLMFPVILISILLACLPLLLLLSLALNVFLKELLPFLLSWNLKNKLIVRYCYMPCLDMTTLASVSTHASTLGIATAKDRNRQGSSTCDYMQHAECTLSGL